MGSVNFQSRYQPHRNYHAVQRRVKLLPGRRIQVIGAAGILLILIFLVCLGPPWLSNSTWMLSSDHSGVESGLRSSTTVLTLRDFGEAVNQAAREARIFSTFPKYDLADDFLGKVHCYPFTEPESLYTCDQVTMEPEQIRLARNQWQTFMEHAPLYPRRIYNGKGIVIVGGGPNLFLNAIASVSSIRKRGCQLPVEMWFFEHEMPEEGVKTMLRDLNVDFRSIGDLGLQKFEEFAFLGKKYQSKMLALIASSFEEVLMIDADNTPVLDPTDLFEDKMYRSNGAMFWSDFWQGIAPKVYQDILDLPASVLNSRGSFESGQMLINKAVAWPGLMAALVFNLQAEIHYVLPTCGKCGAGDKETFANGFEVTNTRYYKVPFGPKVIGGRNPQGEFAFGGVIQWDHRTLEQVDRRPLFVHRIGFKLDITKFEGEPWRKLEKEVKDLVGFDLERELYEASVRVGCSEEFREHFSVHMDGKSYPSCEELKHWLSKIPQY